MVRRMTFSLTLMSIGCIGLAVATAAGNPIPVGSLLGSKNAILDGKVPLPHTTLLSGDSLQVNGGLAMVALDQGNRMILGRATEVSFSKDAGRVTVSLTRGTISLYHAEAGTGFQVKAGDATVVPARGFRTMGEIAMVNGLLVVTAKEGALQVEKAGTTREVSKGKTITIVTRAARAPMPVPPGNLHISHKSIITMGAVVGGAATTLAAIALTRTSATASPITPVP